MRKLTEKQIEELMDHVSACQSAYYMACVGSRFSSEDELEANHENLVIFVESLLEDGDVLEKNEAAD